MFEKSYSLRTILIGLLLAFAIIPIVIISSYAIYSYQQMAEKEQVGRINGSQRELQAFIDEIQENLLHDLKKFKTDNTFMYYVSLSDTSEAKRIMSHWLKRSSGAALRLYNRSGFLEISLIKNKKNKIRDISSMQRSIYNLNKPSKNSLDKKTFLYTMERVSDQSRFYITTKLISRSGRFVGYIQESFHAKSKNTKELGEKMNVAIINATPNNIMLSSIDKISAQDKAEFLKNSKTKDKTFVANFNSLPHVFKKVPFKWGDMTFNTYIGVSTKVFAEMVKNTQRTFLAFSVVLAAILFILGLLVSEKVIAPISNLVEVLKSKTPGEEKVEVDPGSAKEFRSLAESFNSMSKKVYASQNQLRTKVTDLEGAQVKIKETQTQLVHSAKMASLGQLVAGVAHELNNPIGFMYSNVSFLSKYVKQLISIIDNAEKDPNSIKTLISESDYEYIKKDIDRVVESFREGSQRTRDIVMDLRSFSRLEEAKLKESSLEEGIDSTIKLLKTDIKNRVKINKSYLPVGKVLCYPSQLNQVFMNLISNALQAIDKQGEITISTGYTNEGDVEIKIKDTGSGMSEEVVQRIFEPFYTTKDVGSGTGLGLSLSYGIIQKHNGDIYVKSEPGLGAEFIIHLPKMDS